MILTELKILGVFPPEIFLGGWCSKISINFVMGILLGVPLGVPFKGWDTGGAQALLKLSVQVLMTDDNNPTFDWDWGQSC